ncbi:MAG: Asp-tRNA(Asn)/Glu-tRNA(Gln) amidotransferase subunit GatC [Burkholderiaceae bacterium]
MSLTAADVRRIAQLARLELSEADAQHTLAQLNDVFGLIEALRAVDTTGVEPMTHAQDMTLRLRADEVAEPDRRDDYQRNAPAVEQGLFLVPRVIE